MPCNHSDRHQPQPTHAERATAFVLALTLVTMAVEVLTGWWTGSMAPLSDGWHMGMHAAAIGVALFAYRFARWHRRSGRYTFGAGKAADLGAFANAIMLAVVAVMIAGESLQKLIVPGPIRFETALTVAVIGLGVNLVSAWLLREQPHQHGCEHAHDNNREAALVHVVSDALTSGLAIAALVCGRNFGLVWLDPLVGLVGAVVIFRWSFVLIRNSGDVLLDAAPPRAMVETIAAIVARHDADLHDLYVWPIAAGRYTAALKISSGRVEGCRTEIMELPRIAYLMIERPDAEEACSAPAEAFCQKTLIPT